MKRPNKYKSSFASSIASEKPQSNSYPFQFVCQGCYVFCFLFPMNGFECIPGILVKACQATVLGYMPRIHQYNLVKVGHDNKDLQNESLAKMNNDESINSHPGKYKRQILWIV